MFCTCMINKFTFITKVTYYDSSPACCMTIRNATEKQVKHKVGVSFIFEQYLYIDYILAIRHPDDVDRSDRNMLVKTNNM